MEQQTLITYYPLGRKTFILLVLKRTAIVFFPLLIWIALFAIKTIAPVSFIGIINQIIIVGILIIFVLLGLIIFAGWLEYNHYAIIIDQNDFRVRRGFFSQEEIGVPYKMIKEVVIKRNLNEESWGVSRIIITILGEEEGQVFSKESIITLPFIEKEKALEIQNQILQRANSAQ